MTARADRRFGKPKPKTVFVLKDRSGGIRWAEAASAEFGRIRRPIKRGDGFLPGAFQGTQGQAGGARAQ